MRKCPICGEKMYVGIRWSHSRRRLKIFFACERCRLIFYKSDLDTDEKPNNNMDT